MTTAQIEYAATRRNRVFKLVKPHDFKVGDLVLVRNHTSKEFQEKYQDSVCVVWLLGKNQLEVKDQKGHIRQVHITDVKKTTMPEVITNAIPDYTMFGHAVKLRLNPNKVEDLQWTIPEKVSNVQVDETSIEVETTPQQTILGESNDPSKTSLYLVLVHNLEIQARTTLMCHFHWHPKPPWMLRSTPVNTLEISRFVWWMLTEMTRCLCHCLFHENRHILV